MVIRSENISTISILKDVLTKEATKKKKKLEISFGLRILFISHSLSYRLFKLHLLI